MTDPVKVPPAGGTPNPPNEAVIGPGGMVRPLITDDLPRLDAWFNRHFDHADWEPALFDRILAAYNDLKTVL